MLVIVEQPPAHAKDHLAELGHISAHAASRRIVWWCKPRVTDPVGPIVGQDAQPRGRFSGSCVINVVLWAGTHSFGPALVLLSHRCSSLMACPGRGGESGIRTRPTRICDSSGAGAGVVQRRRTVSKAASESGNCGGDTRAFLNNFKDSSDSTTCRTSSCTRFRCSSYAGHFSSTCSKVSGIYTLGTSV